MKSLLVLLIAFGLASFEAHAQKSPFFSIESPNSKSLRLSDLETEVKLDGAFAETTLDLSYFNSSNGNIQGLFKIQLPAGSVIRDFALKLGDRWQFGTLTEKHKARESFEEVVRRGMDPAVLAWNNGAEYQVRIFPFPAGGKRSIRIRYWLELPDVSNKFVYNLPLPAGVKLDSFRMKLDARARALEGLEIGSSFAPMTYLKPMGSSKSEFGAIVDEKNFIVPGEFRVSAAQAGSAAVWTAKATPKGDMAYVAARFAEELPKTARALAKNLMVFLDTSRSAKPDQAEEINAALKAIASKYGNVSYYEFDASVRKVAHLDLAHATYDGGTDFNAVHDEILHHQKTGDVDVLLLTDAVPTLHRESEFSTKDLQGVKIFVLPTKGKFNPHFASLLTEGTNGAVLTGNATEMAEAMTRATWRFESFHYDDGTATDIYPEAGTVISPREGVAVYFRSKTDRVPRTGAVVVSNGSERRELKVNFSTAANVPEVENLWAMKKLMNLVPHAEEYAQDLAAHAQRYLLVSPVTSYIVLENVWDYQRFGIAQREENQNAFGGGGGSMAAARTGGVSGSGFLGVFKERAMKGEGLGAAAAPPPEMEVEGAPESADFSAHEMHDVRAKSAVRQGIVPNPTTTATVTSVPAGQSEPAAVADEVSIRDEYIPPVEPAKTGIENALRASDESVKYTKGILLFGRLDKLYAEKNTPTMKDAWFFIEMAKAFAAHGERERAFRVLSNLFEISEEDGKALRALGLVGCFQGQCDFAVKAFKLAIWLRPEEPQNYRDLAWLFAGMGRFQDAQATLNQIKGKQFHARFPGMDQLLARESAWMDALAKGEKRSPAGEDMQTYAWITWNNDNSDADFHIRESKSETVWYQHRQGRGQLSNDFTQGYGPEIYSARGSMFAPDYFVNYYRADQTSASQAVVVKFATLERMSNGQVKIHSKVFPLYKPQQFVRVD